MTAALHVRRPPRVLVIDDNDLARAGMARLLRGAGYDVYVMDSPLGATRTVVRNEIDVVVVDINMPAMRGEKLAALFRNSSKLRRLPVVLVSGACADELEELALQVQADGAVPKTEIQALIPTVAHAARRARDKTS